MRERQGQQAVVNSSVAAKATLLESRKQWALCPCQVTPASSASISVYMHMVYAEDYQCKRAVATGWLNSHGSQPD